MKLFIQPGSGVIPLVKGIERAKQSIEIVIFRYDRSEIEWALTNAVRRGVFVHALIAYTNRGGEKNLRKLEMRLLAAGVTVARTSDDLVRYHDKLIVIDRRELYLLAFNLTYLDIERSRSFGILTQNRKLVQEAVKLFESDTKRQPFTPSNCGFVVSPVNARKELAAFLRKAKKELLIYDTKISDLAMIRILEERARAGVAIRIIGRITKSSDKVPNRQLTEMRLHTRAIVRDRLHAFIGSQSLRKVELDSRREVGIIIRDSKTINGLVKTFEEDWAASEPKDQLGAQPSESAVKVATRVAKLVAEDLPLVAPVLQQAVMEVVGDHSDAALNPKDVQEAVKDAVKKAVKKSIEGVVEEVVDGKESIKPGMKVPTG